MSDHCPSDKELLDWGSAAAAHVRTCSKCAERMERLCDPTSRLKALVSQNVPQPLPPEVSGYSYERAVNDFPVVLGRGRFGIVYLARRKSNGRAVAIKFLQEAAGVSTDDRGAFMHEAASALNLRHPSIVQGYDAGAVGGRLYYVMECIPGRVRAGFDGITPGETLHAYLMGKPLFVDRPDGIARIVELLVQLADALDHAHTQSLVHRDLHPGNLLIVPSSGGDDIERVKILDFGLARRQGASDQAIPTGYEGGFIAFLPPELFQATPEVTPAVDIYAIGCIAYLMLTGRQPYNAGEANLRARIRAGQVIPLDGRPQPIPRQLEAIVRKCLRPVAVTRYESARELKEDLERFRRGHSIRSWSSVSTDLLVRWGRKNPGVIRAGVIIALLSVVTTGIAIFAWVQMRAAEANRRLADQNAYQAQEYGRLAVTEARERLVSSARAALKRGDLRSAENAYNSAVEWSSPDDRRTLELERLRTLTPNNRWTRLREELDRLAKAEDLTPSQRAVLLLAQGDYDLMDSDEASQKRGKERVQTALASGLDAVDASYARGLLAVGLNAATTAFEAVVAAGADPFHHRANSCLLVCYTLSGRFAEARRHAQFMERAFPGEPVVPLVLALMAAIEKDDEKLARYKEDLLPRLSPTHRDTVAGLLDGLAVTAKTGPLGPGLMGGFKPVGKDGFAFGPMAAVVGVGLPVWQHVLKEIDDLGWAFLYTTFGQLDTAERLLKSAAARSPEGFIRFQQGMISINRGAAASRMGDIKAMLEHSRETRRYFREASEAPTLFPFLFHRRASDWLSLLLEAGADATTSKEASRAASLVLSRGNSCEVLPPLLMGWMFSPRVSPNETNRNFVRLLMPDPVQDRYCRELLFSLLPQMRAEEGRLLLEAWSRDEPEQPGPYALRAELERRENRPEEARRWVERGRRLFPNDGRLKSLEEQIRP